MQDMANPDAVRRRRTFHRGDVVNFTPNSADYRSDTFLQDYLLKGWTPAAPFLTRDTKITAFGSCFAANITRHLSSIGYDLSAKRDPDIYISRVGDGLVNTAAILGQIEWALENKQQPTDLWHGWQAEGFGYDEDIRQRTRKVFLSTEFFIITLGLSEVWYDEKTGGTFWRAVPEESFDPTRHKFRVQSMAETKADIATMHRLIRTHVPNSKILFTVSPIPLAATFRPVSCLTANSVSKAIIRAALDEHLRASPDLGTGLFYFPSMEIVQLAFVNPWTKDVRHPQSYVLDTVMKTFEACYCKDEATLDDANRMLQMFRTRNLRDIAQQIDENPASARQIEESESAVRAGKLARKQAKAAQKNLRGVASRPAREDREAKRSVRRQRRKSRAADA